MKQSGNVFFLKQMREIALLLCKWKNVGKDNRLNKESEEFGPIFYHLLSHSFIVIFTYLFTPFDFFFYQLSWGNYSVWSSSEIQRFWNTVSLRRKAGKNLSCCNKYGCAIVGFWATFTYYMRGVPEALSHKNPADFLLKHKSLHMIWNHGVLALSCFGKNATLYSPLYVNAMHAVAQPMCLIHTHTHMQSPWGQLNPISIIIWSNCVVGYRQHCHMFKNPQNTDWNQLLFVYYPSTRSQTLTYTHTHC